MKKLKNLVSNMSRMKRKSDKAYQRVVKKATSVGGGAQIVGGEAPRGEGFALRLVARPAGNVMGRRAH